MITDLMSHHLMNPSLEPVKNSCPVFPIHLNVYTTSEWLSSNSLWPAAMPPSLSSHQHTWAHAADH